MKVPTTQMALVSSNFMEQHEQKELVKEYHDREVKWADKSLNQLSFFNNLLLTLSVGFLTFAYKNYSFNKLAFNIRNPNWSLTFGIFSIYLIVFSIIIGLFVVLNRLYDFRLTRQVNQIRHRMIEHSGIKLDESSPDRFSFLKRLILPFQVMFKTPQVSMNECKTFRNFTFQEQNKIKQRFRELRNITHNLGISSWQKTNLQILFFGLSILFYFVVELRK